MLKRADILSAETLRTEKVKVPEWGGDVMVRELTGAERDEYESSLVSANGSRVQVSAQNMRARLVAMTCVDEAGKKLFTQKDVAALGEKSARALDRIVDVAVRLSGIGADLDELGKG